MWQGDQFSLKFVFKLNLICLVKTPFQNKQLTLRNCGNCFHDIFSCAVLEINKYLVTFRQKSFKFFKLTPELYCIIIHIKSCIIYIVFFALNLGAYFVLAIDLSVCYILKL